MTCPECNGQGGGPDYFGEWDNCPCCKGQGDVTSEHVAEWNAELAAIDEDIDWQISAEAMIA